MPAKFLRGVDLNGQRGLNAADPSAATDLANKQYVDGAVTGLTDLKDPVRLATTANITLSGNQSIDGITTATGDRVLVKGQTAGAENGIYVTAAGAWTRATDADANAEVTRGMATTVLEGGTKGTGATTANPVTYILTTANPITIGTTALTFSPIGSQPVTYSAGAGLTLSGTTFNVGAGTGITANLDDVQIDTNVVVRKYAADCVATTNPQNFPSTGSHGLGTKDLTVSVIENSTGNLVYADVTVTATVITVDFGAAPTAGQYRVVAHG